MINATWSHFSTLKKAERAGLSHSQVYFQTVCLSGEKEFANRDISFNGSGFQGRLLTLIMLINDYILKIWFAVIVWHKIDVLFVNVFSDDLLGLAFTFLAQIQLPLALLQEGSSQQLKHKINLIG